MVCCSFWGQHYLGHAVAWGAVSGKCLSAGQSFEQLSPQQAPDCLAGFASSSSVAPPAVWVTGLLPTVYLLSITLDTLLEIYLYFTRASESGG